MHSRPFARSAAFHDFDEWRDALRVCHAAARRHTLDAWDAEDAGQEAVLRAFRHRGARRDPAAHAGWLCTIARHEAARLGGRAARRAEVPVADVRTQGSAPDAADEARLPDERLRAALRGLAGEDRALLLLRYVADLPHAVIAARLGLPESTVRVRIHRARIRLSNSSAFDPAR
jgi:RNA polymerase sigma-70 factor, ECF subfamily